MNDDDPDHPHRPISTRPSMRGAARYDVLREAEAKAVQEQEKEIFRTTIIARTEGGIMDDKENFIYELVFKPSDPEFRLSPEQIQLMLSYLMELLKQIERR